MTIFWSRAQHHVTTNLMKLAVGKRNVTTNLGIISGCVKEYYFSNKYVNRRRPNTVGVGNM